MSIEKTLEYIHKIKWLGSKPGLSRTRELLGLMGNPQKELKFVHVAGTNGKGSVCAYISSVLQEAGYKTGLYTSPYINRFNERMQINGKSITDEELEELTDYIRPYADGMSDPPTEFEVITALAFEYFARNKCDIVVLEVGMGGELDSTNVIDTPECAVITSIGLDHTKQLGSTITEIAKAKAGIIKGGDTASYESEGDAYEVIKSACVRSGANLVTADFSEIKNLKTGTDGSTFDYKGLCGIKIPLSGTYQPKNCALAVETVRLLAKKGYDITDENIKEGLRKTKWSGRFEILGREPTFILDGAHNPHGMKAAAESIGALFGQKKTVFIVGAMADKDIDGMFSLIVPLADMFFTVTPENERSMPAEDLMRHIEALGGRAVSCEGFSEAVSRAVERAGKDGVVAALGSLYFSSDIRKAYNEYVQGV